MLDYVYAIRSAAFYNVRRKLRNRSHIYMYRTLLISGLAILSATAQADETLSISASQIQSLGITASPLPAKQSGDVSGLPAQVIIPGNQLFIVSTPLPAMVDQTLVGVGDNVKKGQRIAILQSSALAEAQRSYLQSGVQNQLAHDNYIRDEALFHDGIIAESRYRTTKGAAQEAAAALAERRQMLRLSGMSDAAISQLRSSNLSSQLTVVSPIDGVVLEKTAGAGQRLDAFVPIFKIGKTSPLALEIQAPVDATRNLHVGASVAIPAFSASGKLTAIGRSLTGTNQTVLLRGVITQGFENLRAGQYVEATVSTGGNGNDQREIPNSAISRIGGRTVVFEQTAKGFHPLNVTVVSQGVSSSVIKGKFRGDEKIATTGVSALKAAMMGIGEDQ